MKKEILCPDCAKRTARMFRVSGITAGEFVDFQVGILILNCVCDHCNVPLGYNQAGVAMSIGLEIEKDRAPESLNWHREMMFPIRSFDVDAEVKRFSEYLFGRSTERAK